DRVYTDELGYGAYTQYPMPMLSPLNTKTVTVEEKVLGADGKETGETVTVEKIMPTQYMESVVNLGVGKHQAILMTEEYTTIDETLPKSQQIFTKHIYLMGQDVDGVLGTLILPEDMEDEASKDSIGRSEAYVNLPREYTYFQEAEYERILNLVESAKETINKYGVRYESEWQQKKVEYETMLGRYYDLYVSKNKAEPTNSQLIFYFLQNSTSAAERELYRYMTANQDWVLSAVQNTADEVVEAYKTHGDTKVKIEEANAKLDQYEEIVGLWTRLLGDPKTNTKGDLDGEVRYQNYKTYADAVTAAKEKVDAAQEELSNAEIEANKTATAYLAAQAEVRTAEQQVESLENLQTELGLEDDEAMNEQIDQAKTARDQAKERELAAAEANNAASDVVSEKTANLNARTKEYNEAREKALKADSYDGFRALLQEIQSGSSTGVDQNGDPSKWKDYAKLHLEDMKLEEYATLTAHQEIAKQNLEAVKTNIKNLGVVLQNAANDIGYAESYLKYMAEVTRMTVTVKGRPAKVEDNTANIARQITYEIYDNTATTGASHADDIYQNYLEAKQAIEAFEKVVDGKSAADVNMAVNGRALRDQADQIGQYAKTLSKWLSGDLYKAYLEVAKSSGKSDKELLGSGNTQMLSHKLTSLTFHDDGIISEISSVYAGTAYTGAITEDGYLYLWGNNGEQSTTDTTQSGSILGNRETTGVSATPSFVYKKDIGGDYIDGLVRLGNNSGTLVNRHMLAHRDTGTTYAWGNNAKGQLGNRTTTPSNVPVVVGSGNVSIEPTITLNLQGVREKRTTLLEEGTEYLMVYNNAAGQGGYKWKSLDDSIAEVKAEDANTNTGNIIAVREGETRVLAENQVTGQIVFTRVIVTDGVTYPQLVLGRDTTTALKKDGTVWAWGDNMYHIVDTDPNSPDYGEYMGEPTGVGKLGVGSSQSLITAPVRLGFYYDTIGYADDDIADSEQRHVFENITKIAAGDNHMLAVDEDGVVYAWGDNTYGQLGYDPKLYANSSYPVVVHILNEAGKPISNIISVAAGSNHSMALTSTGEVYTWGANESGQLGHGDTSVFTYTAKRMKGFRELPLTGVLDLAATVNASAVLLVDGTIWTVGSNEYGQLGAGYMYTEGVQLGDSEDKGAIYADEKHKEQVNLGLTTTLIQVPYSADAIDVSGRPIAAEPIVSINRIIGRGYNFGIITEGKNAYLWGDNSSNQLGAGEWLQRVQEYDLGMNPLNSFEDPYVQAHPYANRPVKLQDAEGGALEKVIEVSFGGYVGGKVQSLGVTMDVEYDYSGGLETVVDRTYTTYGWGSSEFNKNGSIGGYDDDYARATKFDFFAGLTPDESRAPIKSMAAGGNHSAGYDTNGIVYTFGSNEYGQLGNFTYTSKEDKAGPRPQWNQGKGGYATVGDYMNALDYWKQNGVSSGGAGLVDEEHIAMFEVTERRNEDGTVTELTTENYRFEAKVTQEEKDVPMMVAKYMYSFSVDKEVDEEKTLLLTYDVLDDSIATLGNLNAHATSTQEAGTREKEETFTNDALHQRIVKYKSVTINAPADGNNFGTTRIIAKYEPKKKGADGYPTDEIDEDLSKTGVAILNMLGPDQMGRSDDGEEIVAHPFQAMPQVSAGDEFTLALDIEGVLWTWGNNELGQMGIRDSRKTLINPSPNQEIVDQMATYYTGKDEADEEHFLVQIAAGASHALALDNHGTVWVWGDNSYGQLGLGKDAAQLYRIPQPLESIRGTTDASRIVSVYALDNTSYAVDAQGTLWAWGTDMNVYYNDGGAEIGRDVTREYGNEPTPLSLLARTLEVGEKYVLKGSGTLWQLPDSYTSPDVERLHKAQGSSVGGTVSEETQYVQNIVQIAGHTDEYVYTDSNNELQEMRANHLLAVDKNGYLWSLGDNTFGQSGRIWNEENSGASDVLEAVVVPDKVDPLTGEALDSAVFTQMSAVSDIAAGDSFSAAITKTVEVGEAETLYTRMETIEVDGEATVYNTVSYTEEEWNALFEAGEELHGIDIDKQAAMPRAPVTIDGVTTTRTDYSYSVKLADRPNDEGKTVRTTYTYTKSVGITETDIYTLYTFGANDSGKLALGRGVANRSYPTKVDLNTEDEGNASSVIMVDAGEDHLITVKKDGYMWSAGRNTYGQLGNVSTVNSNVMVMVGQQQVTVTPSVINMVKGQTLDITEEVIKGVDKPLTVKYKAGINLLKQGVDTLTKTDNWTASPLNEIILDVSHGEDIKKANGLTGKDEYTFDHPKFNFTKALASELEGTDYRTVLDAKIAELAKLPANAGMSEEDLYLLAKETFRNAPVGSDDYAYRDNAYVLQFLEEYGESDNCVDWDKYVYNRLAKNPEAPQVSMTNEHYYITGLSLGQTMIRVKVPGLSAAAYVTVKVMENNDAKANPMVAVGETHTLALKSDGTVWSWGDNTYGQLGRETNESMGQIIFPNMVNYAINGALDNKKQNYFQRNGIKVVETVNGKKVERDIKTYEDWLAAGADTGFLNESGFPWDDPDPIVYIVAGANVSYAMTESGIMYAWGRNEMYQLSVGTPGEDVAGVDGTNVRLPMQMITADGMTVGKNVSTNATGYQGVTMDVKSTLDAQTGEYLTTLYFTATDPISEEEKLYGAGYGFMTTVPQALSTDGMSSITQISADYALAGGEVWKLSATQAPDKVTGYVTQINGEDTPVAITQIAAGDKHLLALDEHGGVWAMGDNTYGQLGIQVREGEVLGNQAMPVRVRAGEQEDSIYLGFNGVSTTEGGEEAFNTPIVTEIAAGEYTSYARTSDDKVYAWGLNDHGQMGVGSGDG
ncbi:MAG: hypothetical protein NC131_13010, partial [Roseburia sp.]|nr:hypothetical protein [Roseburia sp.]